MLLNPTPYSGPQGRGLAHPRKARAGVATVEFAVLVPVFLLLVFAFIEFGRGIMVVHLLTNASRLGARTGVIEGISTSQITTAVNNYLTANGIQGDSVTVQVNGGSADASTAKSGDEITVLVTVPVSSVSWIPGGWTPNVKAGTTGYLAGSTLSSQFSLRRE
jgi:Flp pilus assembly protein TadG